MPGSTSASTVSQDLPDVAALSRARLREMAAAGRRVRDVYRVLDRSGDNVVGEILRGVDTFLEWDHYPTGDVYDHGTHAQFYYHAHPVDLRGGEHGHFHTFLRPRGMPRNVRPADVPGIAPPAGDNDALSHLIAISMDRAGFPIRLFTTNRWVTGETWYAGQDVVAMLGRFRIDHAQPSWPTNIWITSMLCLFRPRIEALLRRRDAALADWRRRHPDRDAFEDRALEITSVADISVDAQIAAVAAALRRR